MEKFNEFIDKVLFVGGFRTKKNLAKFLGIDPSAINQWKKSGNIPKNHLKKIEEHFKKSPHFIDLKAIDEGEHDIMSLANDTINIDDDNGHKESMSGIEFKEKRISLGLTQEKLAKILDISKRQIINIEKSKNPVKRVYEVKLNSIAEYITNKSNNDINCYIPMLSAVASAGSGVENFETDIIGSFPVPNIYFKTPPNLKHLRALKVIGDSMTPTLNNDDIVVIEECMEFKNDGVYVINLCGELRVKRLIRRIDGIEIKSDNPTYGSEFIKNDGLKGFFIVGRVRLEIKRC